jgi:electron transport complex protein RnfC
MALPGAQRGKAIVNTLHTFNGGVHPDEHKLESSALSSARAPIPSRLILPLHQHIGQQAKAVVKPGDQVLKGQMLAQAVGMMSAAIHAPTSGTIQDIELQTVINPSALPELCITLLPDGKEEWIAHAAIDYRNLSKTALLEKLRDGGIVGLGGATFPTHAKFNLDQGIQTLVINGAECEPWITTDDRLMRERAAEIIQGIEIIQYLSNPKETLIGIENNKPEAIAAMQLACAGKNIEVVVIPTLYPSGGEKQLIKILTGKEVPSGGRPRNIGVVCSNVATAYAVHRQINLGEPMISRMITVTGSVHQPQNFEVLLGTPIAELVQFAGGELDSSASYIVGGPMMGLEVSHAQMPVVKSSNCIIVKSEKLFPPIPTAMPCIRCTRCVEVCPAELQPQDLYWFAKAKNLGKAQAFHLFDCIECGACSYVCPSHIPLVQYYRFAKSEIRANERDKEAADMARERHEFHLLRLEREKQEKADKLALREKAALAAKATAAGIDTVAIDALRAQIRETARPDSDLPKE